MATILIPNGPNINLTEIATPLDRDPALQHHSGIADTGVAVQGHSQALQTAIAQTDVPN